MQLRMVVLIPVPLNLLVGAPALNLPLYWPMLACLRGSRLEPSTADASLTNVRGRDWNRTSM